VVLVVLNFTHDEFEEPVLQILSQELQGTINVVRPVCPSARWYQGALLRSDHVKSTIEDHEDEDGVAVNLELLEPLLHFASMHRAVPVVRQ
jgi:hypothetical protein